MKKKRNLFYLAIIPARGGSKRIPNKNLVLFGGKPLISYTVEAALASKKLSNIIVSTDNQEIADFVLSLGIKVPFLRPPEIAQDTSPVIKAIAHTLKKLENIGPVDAVVLLQPTSPFRNAKHIDESIKIFENSGADTLTSVCPATDHPYWYWKLKGDRCIPFFSMKHVNMSRFELPPAYIENGSIFIIKKATVMHGKIYGRKIVPYIMDRRCSIDIDTPEDLQYAEYIFKNRKNKPSLK